MEQNNASDSDELPAIDHTQATDNSVTAVFKNGAMLRYSRVDNTIFEEVFAPSDADSVMERTDLSIDADTDLDDVLRDSSNYYEQFDTRGELVFEWSTLGEWITHE